MNLKNKFLSIGFIIVFCVFTLLTACTKQNNNTTDDLSKINQNQENQPLLSNDSDQDKNTSDPDPESIDSGIILSPQVPNYINPEGNTLDTRILAPEGYTRVPSSKEELTGFLRSLPLKADGSKVLAYNKSPISEQDNHVAVFDIDLSDRDLQQCADSVIRIYGEYYWSIGEYDKIAFHLTNGFYMEYSKWRDGNRIKVDGNNVSWTKTASYDDSYENFRKYIDMVFAYAGTLSLSTESNPIDLDSLLPGDILLQGGSPGHCILIVDMACDEDGNSCYLLAQGYMPAQDFHILTNPLHPEDPWYYEKDLEYPIITPSWTFYEGSLMRWSDFDLDIPSQASNSDNFSSLSLLATGDNLIHIEVVESGKREDGTYNYDHLYDEIKDEIMAADIAIVNQETILGGSTLTYSGYPAFNSPTEIGDALVEAGFDVILHATNHTLDKGYKAVRNTFEHWSQYPEVTVLGINESKEDRNKVPIIEKNGIKVAMLNYTYGLNGYKIPSDMPYLVNMLDKEQMAKDIKKAHEVADFIIVFPHWGSEYVYEPTNSQKELVAFYYDLGVDLVIGAHPHVIQPVEWITSDSDHTMLVFYSLGNFLSYQKEAARMLGGIAHIDIIKDDTGTYISDAAITPIITHYEHGPRDYNYGIYKLSEYSSNMGDRHGVSDIAKNGSFSYEEAVSTAEKVLGSWYLD